MASQPGTQGEPNLVERPNPSHPSGDAAGGEGPSKNALKKAAKEREKAEKAARRAEAEAAEKAKADANDTAKHLYGPLDYTREPPASQKFCDGLWELTGAEDGQEVTVEARVYNARVQSAKLAFLVLREQEHTIQVVIAEGGGRGISRQMVKWCGGINTESYIRVSGLVKPPKEPVKSTSISGFELHVESIYMISEAAEKLPVQVKDCTKPPPSGEEENEVDDQGQPNASLKVRLDNPVLSMRAPAKLAIFKLQSEICKLFTEYMYKHNFTYINPSYMVGAATEGGSGVFEVTYFEKKAYLTQSPQFFKQWAVAGDIKCVFSIGPVFRAENSNTKRHLTEFTGLDYEMPIRNHYHEALDFGERLMTYIIRQLMTRENCKRLTNIVKQAGYTDAGNFQLPEGDGAVRITFAEAKKILRESGYDIGEDDEADIDTSQEKALGDLIRQTYHTDFFTVDQYPASLRPFYTHPSQTNPRLSNSYDFFMRGQDIMSGAQRCHNVQMLEKNMRTKGINPDSEGFKDYVDAFRYGCPPHGGGGLGLNRILQFYLGLNNVREATMFPRDPQRLGP